MARPFVKWNQSFAHVLLDWKTGSHNETRVASNRVWNRTVAQLQQVVSGKVKQAQQSDANAAERGKEKQHKKQQLKEKKKMREKETQNERGKCVQCTQRLCTVGSATSLSLPPSRGRGMGTSMEELLVLLLLPTTHDSRHKREARHFAYNSKLLLRKL